MPRQIGRRLVFLALAALALGTAVYLLDRDWQSARFLELLGTWIPAHVPGDNFGAAGRWLPSFTHAFGFSILTAAVLGWSVRARLAGCAGWVAVNALFELLQATPDRLDLAAVVAGGLAAFLLMALLLPGRRVSEFRAAVVGLVCALGLASIVASTGSEGPVDIREDTSELPAYGFTIGSGNTSPAELLVTRVADELEYTEALAFTEPGLSGLYDTTDGFTLDPGSTLAIDTDRGAPHLGSFTVTVVESLGPFDDGPGDFGGGVYRVVNGVDTVLVRITALVVPNTTALSLEVELRLNDAAPLTLDWSAFTDDSAPIWQRQAVQSYRSLDYLFGTVVARTIFKAENFYDSEAGSEPVETACEAITLGSPAPGNVLNPGSARTTRIGPSVTGSGDDVAIRFTDCAVSYGPFFQYITLYRGDLTLLGATTVVDSRNVLTNFAFATARFEDLQLFDLSANPPPTSLGSPTTLAGGFAVDFFQP